MPLVLPGQPGFPIDWLKMTLIEKTQKGSPVYETPPGHRYHYLDFVHPLFNDFVNSWIENRGTFALALGYGWK